MYENMDIENIVTPVNWRVFETLLRESNYDYGKYKFIIDGFRYGFNIGYTGPKFRQSCAHNLPFTVGNSTILWNKIMKEVKEKRVAGPFNRVPFTNFIQSPIGLVPKAGGNGNETRLIFHLSYNFPGGGSLNSHTPKEMCSVRYRDLDYAVNTCLRVHQDKIKRGIEAQSESADWIYLSKSDLKSAFRILPLAPSSWPWLVMMAKHPISGQVQFFVDKCLPFGASISCSHFQEVSDALKHIIEHLTGRHFTVTNYLDDFLFVSATRNHCNYMVRRFLDLCSQIRFPVSLEKTEWASTKIVFLGILLDGESRSLAIPLDKLVRARHMVDNMLTKNKATVHELQVLCGYLNFLNKAIYPGRAFTRRMYAKYSHIVKPGKKGYDKLKKYHHVRLDKEFKFDCTIWGLFLNGSNRQIVYRPMIDIKKLETAKSLNFYSDASKNKKLGFGCIYNREWIFSQWEPGYIEKYNPSIEYLELYGLCAGIFTWQKELSNCRIAVFCDNKSVVDMINLSTSGCRNCIYLIRLLLLNGLQYNRRLYARHVEGKKNVLADHLSRLRISKFKRLAPKNTKFYPERINSDIYPSSKIWQLK